MTPLDLAPPNPVETFPWLLVLPVIAIILAAVWIIWTIRANKK